MSDEPVRMRDDSSVPREVRDLLQDGARVPPLGVEDRSAILLALAGSTGGSATTTKAPAAASAHVSSQVFVGAGLVAVAGVVGAIFLLGRGDPPPAHGPAVHRPVRGSKRAPCVAHTSARPSVA